MSFTARHHGVEIAAPIKWINACRNMIVGVVADEMLPIMSLPTGM